MKVCEGDNKSLKILRMKDKVSDTVVTYPMHDQLPHHGSVCMYKDCCSRWPQAYSSSCNVCNQRLVSQCLDKMAADLEFLPHYLRWLLLNVSSVVQ